MDENGTLEALFPGELADVLFVPSRYKVVYGGRGGGRSWGCARAALIKGFKDPLRILCVREIQKSIRDSIHKLLSDQIQLLGMGQFYEVQDTTIKGKNGTEFIFSGLSNLTVESIKSYEGVDLAICEEAQAITKNSWDILIPTIRKDNSSIWVIFNPGLETDDTYQRFVVNPPPDTLSLLLNYTHNPFFPAVLEQERLHCQKTDPDSYDNIWLGKCKPAVEGAIYFKQLQAAEKNNQICRVPHDPLLKTHVVFDLGFGHNMSVGMVQKHLSEIRVIDYFQVQGWTLEDCSHELRKRKYNWGSVLLPHDGFNQSHHTGTSSQVILQRLGWTVPDRDEIVELGVEEGIRLVQMTFPQIYFDQERCGDIKDNTATGGLLVGGLIECLKRYRRRLNKQTNTFGSPNQDQFTDGADFLRYVCCNAQNMRNDMEPKRFAPVMPRYGSLNATVGY